MGVKVDMSKLMIELIGIYLMQFSVVWGFRLTFVGSSKYVYRRFINLFSLMVDWREVLNLRRDFNKVTLSRHTCL